MYYMYHAVPENMIGDNLIPLNKMRESMPELRSKYLEKYKDRQEILERKIPLLNCLWNDVIQFLPLHPRKVFEAQRDLGIITEIPHYRYFEIDPATLDPNKTVIYFKSAPGEENSEVKWLKDVNISGIQEVPDETIEYYKTLVGTDDLPFNYQFIPHVLTMNSVNVSSSKIITI